jgi:hypothetical protein
MRFFALSLLMLFSSCSGLIWSLLLIRASASFSVWSTTLFFERKSMMASSVDWFVVLSLLVFAASIEY